MYSIMACICHISMASSFLCVGFVLYTIEKCIPYLLTYHLHHCYSLLISLSSDELERHEDYFVKLAIHLLSEYKVN